MHKAFCRTYEVSIQSVRTCDGPSMPIVMSAPDFLKVKVGCRKAVFDCDVLLYPPSR